MIMEEESHIYVNDSRKPTLGDCHDIVLFGVHEDQDLLTMEGMRVRVEEYHLIVVIRNLRGTGMTNAIIARCMATQRWIAINS